MFTAQASVLDVLCVLRRVPLFLTLLTATPPQPAQAITRVPGARCSLWFKGEFYDNVYTRRRGITAGTWPKHKIKFDFDGGSSQ